MIKKYILLSLCLLISTMSCADIKIFSISKTNTILVEKNQPTFIIKLKANPTTGYSWSLQKYEAKLITLLDHHYQKLNSRLIGSGGFEIWKFKANMRAFSGAHKTDLYFKYARSWELEKGSMVVFHVIIK